MFLAITLPAGTFLTGLILGFFAGWFLHKYVSHKEIKNWERSLITIVVTFAWAVSLVFDIFWIGYDTPVAVHGVMGLVAGYFFEGSIIDVLKKK